MPANRSSVTAEDDSLQQPARETTNDPTHWRDQPTECVQLMTTQAEAPAHYASQGG